MPLPEAHGLARRSPASRWHGFSFSSHGRWRRPFATISPDGRPRFRRQWRKGRLGPERFTRPCLPGNVQHGGVFAERVDEQRADAAGCAHAAACPEQPPSTFPAISREHRDLNSATCAAAGRSDEPGELWLTSLRRRLKTPKISSRKSSESCRRSALPVRQWPDIRSRQVPVVIRQGAQVFWILGRCDASRLLMGTQGSSGRRSAAEAGAATGKRRVQGGNGVGLDWSSRNQESRGRAGKPLYLRCVPLASRRCAWPHWPRRECMDIVWLPTSGRRAAFVGVSLVSLAVRRRAWGPTVGVLRAVAEAIRSPACGFRPVAISRKSREDAERLPHKQCAEASLADAELQSRRASMVGRAFSEKHSRKTFSAAGRGARVVCASTPPKVLGRVASEVASVCVASTRPFKHASRRYR